ncbi:MAG: VOC family protein, partial [Fibrella sp.]|nr:VOC family protein [Armatimonadota bacterium]
THLAFTVEAQDMANWEQRLRNLGVTLLPGRTRSEEEGQSLYFADPDGHLLELHTGSLQQRLQVH